MREISWICGQKKQIRAFRELAKDGWHIEETGCTLILYATQDPPETQRLWYILEDKFCLNSDDALDRADSGYEETYAPGRIFTI